jgi:hypothetical protein
MDGRRTAAGPFCEHTVNLNSVAFHIAPDDRLVINETTRHQYYATMQAEACDEEMLDVVFNRRRAQALQAREHRKLAAWFLLLSGCAVIGLLWALV